MKWLVILSLLRTLNSSLMLTLLTHPAINTHANPQRQHADSPSPGLKNSYDFMALGG